MKPSVGTQRGGDAVSGEGCWALKPPTPARRHSRHEAELGVCGEGLPLPQGSSGQQPFLPTAVVPGTVPALVLHRRGGRSRWLPARVPLSAPHLPLASPLTSQASRMVTMSPLRNASSPGLGREFSHLVIHCVPGAQRRWEGDRGRGCQGNQGQVDSGGTGRAERNGKQVGTREDRR